MTAGLKHRLTLFYFLFLAGCGMAGVPLVVPEWGETSRRKKQVTKRTVSVGTREAFCGQN
jgi:hypothetical protein